MVFQVFHSFPAQDTAWGTSLPPLPPEPSVSTRCLCPRCPAWCWVCLGSPPLFADCTAEQPGPNSGKHDIRPALHHGLWPSLQPRCFYLCVSASLVKTAAASSASSCPRGFRQYRTKYHALFPSLVFLVRHQNIPHHHPRQLSLWATCRKGYQKPHWYWFLATLPTRVPTGSDKSESQFQFRAPDSFTCQLLDFPNMFLQPVT